MNRSTTLNAASYPTSHIDMASTHCCISSIQKRLYAYLQFAVLCAATFSSSFAIADSTYSEVTAWGYNDYQQCNVPDSAKNGVTAIAGGEQHTMALKNGAVLTWNFNGYGIRTVPFNAQSGVTAIASGYQHCVALKNGIVMAWGNNGEGQCNVPYYALSGVTAIACGFDHTIALKDGAVLAWGRSQYGQCNVPQSALSEVTAIGSTYRGTIALKNGAVLVWGYNGNGECNIPSNAQSGVSTIASGGADHIVALKAGAVLAWGSNGNGQCNIPSNAQSGVTAIAAGYYHTLALKNGAVLAWGRNSEGQCNIPSNAQSGVTAIAGGYLHTIAIRTVHDCNQNGSDDLLDITNGTKDLNHDFIPDTCQGAVEYAVTSASLGVPTANVAANFTFTNLVPSDADVPLTIRATGDFDNATEYLTLKLNGVAKQLLFEIGVNCSVGSNTAVFNIPMADFAAYAAAGSLTVTLLPSNTVTGSECGSGSMTVNLQYLGIGPGGDCDTNGKLDVREIGLNAQLDYNHNSILDFCDCRDTPALDRDRNGVLDVLDCLNFPSIDCNSNGRIDTYELFDQPALDCNGNGVLDSCDSAGAKTDISLGWGRNRDRYSWSEKGQATPPTGVNFRQLASGEFHSVGIQQNGLVYCFGTGSGWPDDYGQLNTPWDLGECIQVAAAGFNTAALKMNGTIRVWGANDYGQNTVPTNLTPCTQVAMGGWDASTFVLALQNNGAVKAWGLNNYSQCTIPSLAQSGVIQLGAGSCHSVALKNNGSVLAWGNNDYGMCNVPSSATSGVIQIAAGGEPWVGHTVALKGNGSVIVWGYNGNGQCLGTDVNNASRNSQSEDGSQPVTILGQPLTNVSKIACGSQHSVAVKTDGSVVAWGLNNYGQCTVPSTARNIDSVACGAWQTLIIKRAIDANNNDRPDTCDMSDDPALDRNANGIIDALEITRAPAIDCNRNSIIDAFDLTDYPEWDCDLNGRIDTCDFAEGASDDDLDGHLDICEWARGDLDMNGVVDMGDIGVLLLYWGEFNPSFGDLDNSGNIDGGDSAVILLNFGDVSWP